MKVVVLGGGYAGIICALRLARKGVSVALVNASDRFVERIRLHEMAVGHPPRVRAIARFVEGTNVELVIGRAARVEGKLVQLEDGRELAFDHLVLALGSRPERRAGTVSLDGVRRAESVLVVGGGLTGIETASEIAEAWPDTCVTLVTRGAVGAGFTEPARAHVRRAFARAHIELRENTDYETVASDFELTIWAGGFVGAELPAGLDVKTSSRGQVLVEPTLRALGTDAAVWVCGDLAAQASPPPVPIPMGCKAAGPSAARVADNILAIEAGNAPRPFDFVAPGYCVSLGRRDGFVELSSGKLVTGRIAAWIKELVCKATLWAFALERWGAASYGYFERGNVRELDGSRDGRDLPAGPVPASGVGSAS
ncbi:MAG: FAD-dependent oxidoreductase [Labilithrix sp.]